MQKSYINSNVGQDNINSNYISKIKRKKNKYFFNFIY